MSEEETKTSTIVEDQYIQFNLECYRNTERIKDQSIIFNKRLLETGYQCGSCGSHLKIRLHSLENLRQIKLAIILSIIISVAFYTMTWYVQPFIPDLVALAIPAAMTIIALDLDYYQFALFVVGGLILAFVLGFFLSFWAMYIFTLLTIVLMTKVHKLFNLAPISTEQMDDHKIRIIRHSHGSGPDPILTTSSK